MPPKLRLGINATAIAAGIYAAVVGLACVSYRKVLYPAPGDPNVPTPAGATMRELVAEDGVVVHALHFRAEGAARTVVHFHGNGQTIADTYGVAEELHARGLGVMLVEYRGYGVSSGSPTEEGLYRDASAALDALAAEGSGPDHVVLWGTSLGTGVAAEMAARGRAAALVLVTPYTSIPRVAGRHAPFLPASVIVGDRFDTLAKAPRIKMPVLVIHGDRDEVVPYDMGRDVAAAIAGAKLITVPGGHHNDLFARDGSHLLAAIVSTARDEP